MNRNRMITLTLIAGMGLVGLGATSHQLAAAHDRSQGRPGGFGPMGHLCDDNASDKLERVSAYLSSELDLTADQSQKWDAVTQVVQASDVSALCSAATEVDDSAIAKLNHLETTLTASLNTVQQVKPPFETFYGSLSESQQQTLNQLMSRRHRGRHQDRHQDR
ncbi:MAG: Spy/CpxP family protein refolding chaperone [Cyanobacteria bacterium]|nr:Spy/CpxP family protein refolding chaperone [Cyanobacteriota bacterium]